MPKRSDNSRPLTHPRGALACAAALFVLFPLVSKAQTSTDPPPANPAPAAASPAPVSGASQKPASPAKPKRVITNDDLEPHSTKGAKADKFTAGEGSIL